MTPTVTLMVGCFRDNRQIFNGVICQTTLVTSDSDLNHYSLLLTLASIFLWDWLQPLKLGFVLFAVVKLFLNMNVYELIIVAYVQKIMNSNK